MPLPQESCRACNFFVERRKPRFTLFLLPLLQNKQNKYIKIKDGIESLDGIKITEENLTVTVSGIGNLDAGTDYTYEVWLGYLSTRNEGRG